MTKGQEIGEQVRVARQNLRQEIVVQEADQLLKGLRTSGSIARGEDLRGERGRVKEREEGGEDWIGGEDL